MMHSDPVRIREEADTRSCYADLHIHIGRTESGKPVKISASRDLTLYNIARVASELKGIELVGIIDCHSPEVQSEITAYLDKGEMEEQEGGGIRYRNTTIVLGSEIEVRDPGLKPAHLLAYLPTLSAMKEFTGWLKPVMKNVGLSSQRIYVTARTLQDEVLARGGILIPAHVFTPYKGVYGSSARRMEQLLDVRRLAAAELGLSSDTEMAGLISELDTLPFVTNSDAHSLAKIGREYNLLKLQSSSFEELVKALKGADGRGIEANYGLNPRLGKYYRTFCASCESIIDERETTVDRCLYCGCTTIVRGVMDRIVDIADRSRPDPTVAAGRPPYRYQVPLEFIPGLGPRKLKLLLERFGTEMNVIHRVDERDLAACVGEEIAEFIMKARGGSLSLEAGGGGQYGKVSR